MLQRYTECLHLENGQDLEERERLLQEMTFLRMFMDIVRISVVTSSSKVGHGDVLAFQSMLEGWNVLQLYTWFHRLFYLGIIGICPALDDRKSHGQQLAEAKLVQAGCVGHSLQLREVKPRKPHSMLGT